MIIAFNGEYLHVGFYALTLLTLWWFYRLTGRRRWVLWGGLAWLLLTGVLAATGFFRVADTLPPRLAYPMVTTLAAGLYLGFSPRMQAFRAGANLEGLHYLHAVRIAVEVFFLKSFADRGTVADALTYEGYNFDLTMGVLLPLTGWLVYRVKRLPPGWSVAANVLGIFVLAATVGVAVLSTPTPYQVFGLDQPTVAILELPLIYLPVLVAPLMFWAHFVVLGAYLDRRGVTD